MSTTNSVYPLGVPVLSVDEQIVFVPAAGLSVMNRARKLLFFWEANCRHRVEGLSDFEADLKAGDVLVLPHSCQQIYQPHDSATARVHAVRLILEPELIAPLALAPRTEPLRAEPTRGDEVAEWAAARFDRAAFLPGGINAEVRETLARLRREAESGAAARRADYRLRVGAACLELLVLVARQLEAAPLEMSGRGTTGAFRVEEVREYILKHLETPLRLAIIAEHLQISPEHLARVWKRATGSTIFDYVRHARVEHAKSLLIASDLNLSQIALECGFSSLSLFSRTFKNETGVAPGRYREGLAL